MINLLSKIYLSAVINQTTNSVAVVDNVAKSSSDLNYVIGGIFIIILTILGGFILIKK